MLLKRLVFGLVVMLFCVMISSQVEAVEFNFTCGYTLNTSGSYELGKSIENCSTGPGHVLDITVSNVNIDCRGFLINTSTSIAALFKADSPGPNPIENITIRNCNFTTLENYDVTPVIDIDEAQNISIINNTINLPFSPVNIQAIQIEDTTHSRVVENTVVANQTLVRFNRVDHTRIDQNSLTGDLIYALRISSSTYVNVSDNNLSVIRNVTLIESSSNISLSNNNLTATLRGGITVSTGSDLNFSDNIIDSGTGNHALALSSVTNSIFSRNIITAGNNEAVLMSGTSGQNEFIANTISARDATIWFQNGGFGGDTSINSFSNNVINASVGTAISFGSTTRGNTFVNDTIFGNDTALDIYDHVPSGFGSATYSDNTFILGSITAFQTAINFRAGAGGNIFENVAILATDSTTIADAGTNNTIRFNNSYGSVNWTIDADFDVGESALISSANVVIANNSIYVNDSNLTTLTGLPANITFSGISFSPISNYRVLINDTACGACGNVAGLSATTFQAFVPGFSTYSLGLNYTFELHFPANTTYNYTPLIYNATLAETGAMWFSYDGGVTNTSMDTSDNISFTYSANISDGDYNISFYATNSSGMISIVRNASFSLDTTPPAITINTPAATTFNTSSVTFNMTVNDTSQGFFSLDGGVNNITMATSDNLTFNYTNTSVPDGNYTVTFYAIDGVGFLSTRTRNFVVDTTPSSIVINSPNATPENLFVPNITVDADTQLCQMWYNVTDQTTNGTISGTECTFSAIAGYTGLLGMLNFTVFDEVNNTNTTSFNFTMNDTVAPTLSSYSPTGDQSDGTSIAVSATLSENGSVYYRRSGGSFIFCFANQTSGTCPSFTFNGYTVVTLNMTDISGNSRTTQIIYDLDLDGSSSSGGSAGGSGAVGTSVESISLGSGTNGGGSSSEESVEIEGEALDSWELEIGDAIQEARIKRIDDTSVDLEIEGTIYTLQKGESTTVDADGDGNDDYEVTLDDIVQSKAQFTLSLLTYTVEIPVNDEEVEAVVVEVSDGADQEEVTVGSTDNLLIEEETETKAENPLGAILVVVAIVGLLGLGIFTVYTKLKK